MSKINTRATILLKALFASVYLLIHYIEKPNRRQGDKLAENVKHHILQVVIKTCYVRASLQRSQGFKPKVIFLFCFCDYCALALFVEL